MKTSISLPTELVQRLRAFEARNHGVRISVSEICRYALKRRLEVCEHLEDKPDDAHDDGYEEWTTSPYGD